MHSIQYSMWTCFKVEAGSVRAEKGVAGNWANVRGGKLNAAGCTKVPPKGGDGKGLSSCIEPPSLPCGGVGGSGFGENGSGLKAVKTWHNSRAVGETGETVVGGGKWEIAGGQRSLWGFLCCYCAH